MPDPGVVYKQAGVPVRRVFYQTATKLVLGQPLCYQEVISSTTKGTSVDVEIPNTNNEAFFAGIVHPSSQGITGPNYIDMLLPRKGDIIQVLCGNKLGIAVGDYLKLDFDIPTTTGSELGALDGYALLADLSTIVGHTKLEASLQTAHRCLGQALESVAVTSAGAVGTRTVQWVQFL